MTLTFTSTTDYQFHLAGTLFNILDRNNIFDNYQEDNNYISDCIFKTSKNNIESLYNDLINIVNVIPEYLKDEFISFTKFIKNSEGIIMTSV